MDFVDFKPQVFKQIKEPTQLIEEVVHIIINGTQIDYPQDNYISYPNTAAEIAAENNVNSEIEEKGKQALDARDKEITEDIILNNILSNTETEENRVDKNLREHIKNTIEKDNQQFLTTTETSEKIVSKDGETSSSANLPTLTDVISDEKDVVRRSKGLAEKDKKLYDR